MWINRYEYQEIVEELEEIKKENYELKERLAKSGNSYYLKDASAYAQGYHEICREKALAEAEITKLEIENEYLRKVLNSVKPEKISNAYRDDNGRFIGEDGNSKLKQQEIIYSCLQAGMEIEDIASEMNLKPETIKLYIGQYEDYMGNKKILVGNLSEEGYGEMRQVPASEVKNGVWSKDNKYRVVDE